MDASSSRYRVPILASLVGLGLVVALWMLRKALAPFFLAMVLAYLLAPTVQILSRRMKRGWAVTLVGLGALGCLAALVQLGVPRLMDQVDRLITNMPLWKRALEVRWNPWLETHPWVRAKLEQGMEGLDPMILLKGAWGAGADLLGWFLQALSLLLVPVIVYYLLVEGPDLLRAFQEMIPPRHRERIQNLIGNVHERLGGYIRGQIAVAAAMALLQSVALQIVGAPYPWLLGLIAGVSNIIPYSPYLTALLPALVVARLGGDSGGRLLLIALVFTGVQKLETLYFTPVWVGRASRLHPLEVLLAILCFGFAFGVLGLIFAVPLMIVVKVVLELLTADYKRHPWFVDDHESAPEA